MNEIGCEDVLIAKMAEADGESPVSAAVNEHVEACEKCRTEIAAMEELDHVLRQHVAVRSEENVWPFVRERIVKRSTRLGWGSLAILVAAMASFKIIELSLRSDPGLLFGLVPLAFAALLFILLRENPFKVNTELILESDHG